MAATTNCGARMQMAITAVAHSGARVVKDPAMIGSMAALESWNSKIAATKIKSAQLRVMLARASNHAPPSRLGAPPRASSGSMSAERICEGDERWDAEGGRDQKDRLVREVVRNGSHEAGGDRIAQR
jgi:hypothetical protein